jgi:alpha-L-fucosidase 2
MINATVSQHEKLGTGLWVGFSFPWMANLYAIQGNGEGAAYQLKIFMDCFCSKNWFNLNGDYKKRGVSQLHYRPFTLEGNMAAADALQEMLLDSVGGVVRVFRAVPGDWKKGRSSFSGFRAENGVIVSAELTNGNVSYILLQSEKPGIVLVENRFSSRKIKIEIDGNEIRETECEIGKVFEVSMDVGQSCRLTGISD